MPSPFHLPTALAYAVLALGHTSKGLSQFSHPSLTSVNPQVRGAAKIGWYEGSVWFVIAGVLNYKWSVTGLADGADRAVAGLLVALLVGAGASYWRVSDRSTAGVLLAVGVLQALGLRG